MALQLTDDQGLIASGIRMPLSILSNLAGERWKETQWSKPNAEVFSSVMLLVDVQSAVQSCRTSPRSTKSPRHADSSRVVCRCLRARPVHSIVKSCCSIRPAYPYRSIYLGLRAPEGLFVVSYSVSVAICLLSYERQQCHIFIVGAAVWLTVSWDERWGMPYSAEGLSLLGSSLIPDRSEHTFCPNSLGSRDRTLPMTAVSPLRR